MPKLHSNNTNFFSMKKIALILLSFGLMLNVKSQKQCWTLHTSTEKVVTDKSVARLSFPTDFKLFDLDIQTLRSSLFTIVGNRSGQHTTVVSLPNADGGVEQFEVVEASNFEPALQERFPEIRAFSGRGLTDKYATLKLSISPQGIQTMVFRTDKPNEFIEPYSQDHAVYAVFKSQRKPGQLPWTCSTVEQRMAVDLNNQVYNTNITARSGADLKTMRLAQSCNAEYSNYFGATSSAQVNLVLAAYNNTLTRCNGIYEKDFALHLNLIPTTTNVIYYTASSDPYTTLSSWNSQLQSTLNSVIGAANYDIGHMFGSTGGGGNAGCIGCVCVDASKGSGITSPADGIPQGDNFDIDYVAHEVGHQLGANHTFSMSNEGTGVNKEVGSGLTIMGYAGITSQDVTNHSIDIFHQASIAQVQANLATKTCPITTSIAANNATPVVATVSNYTIPKSTPFALTGSATDANGDALTYCWEQNDNASSTQTGASSVASATKATGPNWITFPATASPTRLFPKLSTILAGSLISGPLTGGDAGANTEALSSVARTLNFRLTVRDNAPYSSTAPVKVGQTQFTDMVVTVNATAGPFAVTAPNTAVTFTGGSTQNITWSVNSTNLSPVNCANVKISLSTDGGLTFPTVLAASTPNDGTEALVIPAVSTTTARVKIEAVGNIFFDISNANFTISGAAACGDPSGLSSSAISTNSASLSWAAVSGAISYAVDYKLSTSATWTSFATAQTTTSASLTGLTQSSLYDWRVRATCSNGSGNYVSAQFTTATPFVCSSPAGLTASAITSSSATLNWTAVSGAVSYAVDYKLSTDTTWTNIASATTSTSVALSGLATSTTYNYRVSTNCGSNGASGFSTAQFTTAAPFVCNSPATLSTSAITSSGATVSWSAVSGAVSYAVDYKLSTDTVWTNVASATTLTSVTLSGLSASSTYNVRVSSSCGTNGTSGFSSSQFTTAAPFVCNSPSGLTASAITSSGATVSWTAVSGAVSYAIDYKLNSATTWTSAATANTTTTFTLSGLIAGSLYNYRVSTNCGTNGASGFSAAQFTTATASVCVSAFEPNETTTTAAAITSGVVNSAAISTATDVDYFKITTTATSNIVYSLVGPTGVDFDLAVYNSAGTSIGTGATTTSTETVSLTNQAAGTYYIKVYGFSGANSQSCYTLKATATTVTGCQSTYDNSTNNTANNATTTAPVIPFNTNITGVIGTGGDVDNYKFTITTGGTITLTLTTLPANYNLRLVNSAGTILLTSANTGTTNETINYTAAVGTYYARVYGPNTSTFNATSCYTLKVQLGTATKNDALNVSSPAVSVFPNPAERIINVNLEGVEGKSEIQLFDVNGVQVMRKFTTNRNNQLEMAQLPSGVYMLKLVQNGKLLTKTKVVKQ